MKKPAWLFDGRLILDHNELKRIGFQVKAVGVDLSGNNDAFGVSSLGDAD